jgi:hypothetical protein
LATAEEREPGETTPAADIDRRADLRVSAPALDASQQPGFKVVDEAPQARSSKIVWTILVLIVALGAGYYLGYLR